MNAKKVINGLKQFADKHILLKIPVYLLMGIFLLFFYPLSFLYSHMRKVAGVCCLGLIFVAFTSFTFAENVPEAPESPEEPKSLYVNTEEGSILVEEIEPEEVSIAEIKDVTSPESGERDAEVSANDLIMALNAASESRYKIENDFQADDEAKIYEEGVGYVRAAYKDDWSLILINKEHHIPDDYEFELATIRGQIKSDVRVMPYVLNMINAAKEDGVTIYICSPYRSVEKQEVLFKKKQRQYMRKGYSEEEAYELTSQTIAIPGTSEHQVGLAFDFISNDHRTLDAAFAETDGGRWLKDHCAEYGFILRYPLGKENITKIEFEPWHFRYVGVAAATEIMERDICLEEYVKEIGAVE